MCHAHVYACGKAVIEASPSGSAQRTLSDIPFTEGCNETNTSILDEMFSPYKKASFHSNAPILSHSPA